MIKKISLLSLMLMILFGLSGCAKLPFDLPIPIPAVQLPIPSIPSMPQLPVGKTSEPKKSTQTTVENLESTMRLLTDGNEDLWAKTQELEKEIDELTKKIEELEKVKESLSIKDTSKEYTFDGDKLVVEDEESSQKTIDEVFEEGTNYNGKTIKLNISKYNIERTPLIIRDLDGEARTDTRSAITFDIFKDSSVYTFLGKSSVHEGYYSFWEAEVED